MEFLRNVWNEEEGQGLVEYGLIIAVVALVVVVGLTALGGELSTLFDGIVAKLKPTT